MKQLEWIMNLVHNHTLILHKIILQLHLLHAVQLVLSLLLALLGHVMLVVLRVVDSTMTSVSAGPDIG